MSDQTRHGVAESDVGIRFKRLIEPDLDLLPRRMLIKTMNNAHKSCVCQTFT